MAIAESFVYSGDILLKVSRSGSTGHGILFVHGNSCSSADWLPQLNSPELSGRYQLAAFDLPGHGLSGRSTDYSLARMARSVSDVVRSLKWSSYAIVSISLGTVYVSEAVPQLAGLRALAMISPNVTNDQHLPASYLKMIPGIEAAFSAEAPDDVLRKFAEGLALSDDDPVVDDFVASYRQTDGNLRVAVAQAAQQGSWSDEFSNLERSGAPCLFVFGNKEKALNVNYLDDVLNIRGFRKSVVAEAAHFVNKNQPQVTNELLAGFFEESFR